MKKYLFAISSLIFLTIGITACSSDDTGINTIPYQFSEQIGEVNGLTGTVQYDIDYNVWYIIIDNTNKSDNTRYDLPFIATKEKELLEEKLPVKFSGAVYRWIDKEVPYNTDNYFIIPSKLELLL
jgi:hypothetical protein